MINLRVLFSLFVFIRKMVKIYKWTCIQLAIMLKYPLVAYTCPRYTDNEKQMYAGGRQWKEKPQNIFL